MLIKTRSLSKTFLVGNKPFLALSEVDLNIDRSELVFVVGKSGSGKSTLLNMIAGLDRPSRGEIEIAGTPVHTLDEDSLARFRGETIGVVFQFFQLLPTLTVSENVMLAMDFVGRIPANNRRERAYDLLEQVGVSDQAEKLPTALSGGQQQRVAIARALANDPQIVVADEPTGNLDSQTAAKVMTLFSDLTKLGKTVLVVTHERETNVQPTRILSIADGRIRQ